MIGVDTIERLWPKFHDPMTTKDWVEAVWRNAIEHSDQWNYEEGTDLGNEHTDTPF